MAKRKQKQWHHQEANRFRLQDVRQVNWQDFSTKGKNIIQKNKGGSTSFFKIEEDKRTAFSNIKGRSYMDFDSQIITCHFTFFIKFIWTQLIYNFVLAGVQHRDSVVRSFFSGFFLYICYYRMLSRVRCAYRRPSLVIYFMFGSVCMNPKLLNYLPIHPSRLATLTLFLKSVSLFVNKFTQYHF